MLLSILSAFCVLSTCCLALNAAKAFPPVSDLPSHAEFPDPLVLLSGDKVTERKVWLTKRKPELQRLFQHYEYGFFPPPAKIKSTVTYTDETHFGGKATLKLVTISLPPKDAPKIHLMVVIPNQRFGEEPAKNSRTQRPTPVFAGLNFCGNQALVTNRNVPLAKGWMNNKYPGVVNNHATEASRGTLLDMWAIEQTIDRGYAVATFHYGDVQEDQPNAKGGVREFFHGSNSTDHDWATLAAWAWSLHRVVDYLVTNKDLDHKRIVAVGHSRLGKTALLAAAFDERIAMSIPLQAGCGGTAPSRSQIGESVERINKSFPHWFCDEFKKFSGQPEKLPFDQHCLIALCAPRPVLLANATEDTWANPVGQFEMLKLAEPVYRLLGSDGLAVRKMPKENELIDSTLGYYIRPGKHSMTKEDWKIFLDFADKQFEKTKRPFPSKR